MPFLSKFKSPKKAKGNRKEEIQSVTVSERKSSLFQLDWSPRTATWYEPDSTFDYNDYKYYSEAALVDDEDEDDEDQLFSRPRSQYALGLHLNLSNVEFRRPQQQQQQRQRLFSMKDVSAPIVPAIKPLSPTHWDELFDPDYVAKTAAHQHQQRQQQQQQLKLDQHRRARLTSASVSFLPSTTPTPTTTTTAVWSDEWKHHNYHYNRTMSQQHSPAATTPTQAPTPPLVPPRSQLRPNRSPSESDSFTPTSSQTPPPPPQHFTSPSNPPRISSLSSTSTSAPTHAHAHAHTSGPIPTTPSLSSSSSTSTSDHSSPERLSEVITFGGRTANRKPSQGYIERDPYKIRDGAQKKSSSSGVYTPATFPGPHGSPNDPSRSSSISSASTAPTTSEYFVQTPLSPKTRFTAGVKGKFKRISHQLGSTSTSSSSSSHLRDYTISAPGPLLPATPLPPALPPKSPNAAYGYSPESMSSRASLNSPTTPTTPIISYTPSYVLRATAEHNAAVGMNHHLAANGAIGLKHPAPLDFSRAPPSTIGLGLADGNDALRPALYERALGPLDSAPSLAEPAVISSAPASNTPTVTPISPGAPKRAKRKPVPKLDDDVLAQPITATVDIEPHAI